jgi:N-acetylglutamate synthase
MKIRRMVINDYLLVKKLWNECDLREEPEDTKDEIELFLQASQGTGFVAQKNGNIVGSVLCGSDGRYGYIHHLSVSKSVRKQGIGKSLVEECARFLETRHILIMVRENNEVGNIFWKQLNFQNANWLRVQFLMIIT